MPVKRIAALLLIVLCGCGGARDDAETDTPDRLDSEPVSALPVVDGGAPRLLPVDEADSGFAAFRRSALSALQQRDTAFLYDLLAPDIRSSFGGDDGRAGFDRVWRMERPDSSAIWGALTRVLTLGGEMRGQVFVAPYVYAVWPDSLDAFQMVAITGENVAAYARPDATAPVIGRLTHSVLPIEEWPDRDDRGTPRPDGLARLRLPDGRDVWVRAADFYSPVSWRAFFERRAGRWVMITLVAGD